MELLSDYDSFLKHTNMMDSLHNDLNENIPADVGVLTALTCLTNRPALYPHDNWDFRHRTTAGETHYYNSKNRLEQFLHSDSCQYVTLQKPEEKNSKATFAGHLPQIQENLSPDMYENSDLNDSILRTLNIPDVDDQIDADDLDFYADGAESTNEKATDPVAQAAYLAPPSYQEQPTQQCFPTMESIVQLATDSGNSFNVHEVQIHPTDNKSISGSKSETILHTYSSPHFYREQPKQQCYPAVKSNMELATDSGNSFNVHDVQTHPTRNQIISGSKSATIPHTYLPPFYREQTKQQSSPSVESNVDLAPDSGNCFNVHGVQTHPTDSKSISGSKTETILHTYAAQHTYQEHPTQQCTNVGINIDFSPDLENTFVCHGYKIHAADNQSIFGSKHTLPLRPKPCRFKETARKGFNNLSQMMPDSFAAPEPILAPYSKPPSQQQQPTQQSITAVQQQHCKGSNSLSQMMPDFIPAPDLIPPQYSTTTLCQQQQYTSAAKRKIQYDLHQEHPSLAQSGQGCGPAHTKYLSLNTVNEEHLASGSVNEFNGLSSTSSNNNGNTYEKNTHQNETSNGKTSSNRFPRKNQREYTKEELEKMRRNNEASKRSREKRRMEEKKREREKEYLEVKNNILKEKLNTMKNEYNKGSTQMFRMLTIIAQRTRELNDLDTNWTTDNPSRQSDKLNSN